MSDNNNTSESSASTSGISALYLLGVCLVILRLCEVIDWSWWWVTSPFWGGFAIVGVVMILFVAFICFVLAFVLLISRF